MTKKPKDYTNADHLPHVKVAIDRINAGEKDESLVGHTIYYLICKPRDDNMALAKNAFDMKTFKRSARKFNLIKNFSLRTNSRLTTITTKQWFYNQLRDYY